MTCKYYDTGLSWDLPLEVMDKHAAEVDKYMKEAQGWTEIGIGLFFDESKLFLFDCNAIVATVYQRHDTSYQFYCGGDAGGVASIRTVDGLKEFLKDFTNGEFNGMEMWEMETYLQKVRNDYPDYDTSRQMGYKQLKALESEMMAELGWVFNEDKKRWYKK